MSQNPSSGVGTVASPDLILLKRAVLAFRSGDKQTARDLLFEATEHNPDNELVWLWRASAARTRSEAYEAVVRVLDLNPLNEKALQWIEKLRPESPEPLAPAQAEAVQAALPASSNGSSAAPVEEAAEVREEAPQEQAALREQTEEQDAIEAQSREHVEEQAYASQVQEESVAEAPAEAAEASVEEESAAIVTVEEAPPADDAETRLAALEAALGQEPRDQVSESEPEEDRQVGAYLWETREEADTEVFAESRDDSEDVFAELAQSCGASDQAQEEADSDDDPLRALLASHGRSEDTAAVEISEEGESEPEETARYDSDAENDVWESLGMAGMEKQPLPKAGAGDDSGQPGYLSPLEEEEIEEDPACFICEKYAQPQDGICSSCRAIVDLDLLDYTARHEGADRSQLMRALDRLREEIEKKPTVKLYMRAAITSLNLRQSQQALVYLREACRMRPHDRRLVGYYDRLEKRPLILAVDDSKTVQKMISTVLEKESYRVVQAEDGLSAIAKLDEEMPSLILLDITMPRMDGYQVCKVINGNDATKHIPVIMLSGKDGFFDKVRGKMVGASNYITKPFDPAELTKTIAKFVKNN